MMTTIRALASFTMLLAAACGASEPIQVVVDNSNGKYEDLILFGPHDLHWDVKVVVNGVDFGVVKGGTKSEGQTVPVPGSDLIVEVFDVQLNQDGKGVYGVSRENPSGPRIYFGDSDWGYPAKQDAWELSEMMIPLFGDRDRVLKIGFGETPPGM